VTYRDYGPKKGTVPFLQTKRGLSPFYVGCFVWDELKRIEVSSPFPHRVYFILNLGHFLRRFETIDNMIEELVWLPTCHQAREIYRKLDIPAAQVSEVIRIGHPSEPDEGLVNLYRLIGQQLSGTWTTRSFPCRIYVMKTILMSFGVLVSVALILLPIMISPLQSEETTLLIDDFSREDGRSALGTAWRSFSDRVMGGVSLGQHRYETIDGKRSVRLTGDVSLDNNGGFIQVALSLNPRERPFDASPYKGIRLTVRGNDTKYFIHIRSSQSRRPWQYYAAEFEATGEWRTLEIPFSQFEPKSLSEALDPSELRRIAVVAAWENFKADVAVSRLEFYR
jgi:hypothetical protein